MRPLDGVRVLDLSRLLPGPFATLVLADLGATVDKLEDDDAGDYLRYMAPYADGVSVAFSGLNRGKRSLVMNLKMPGAADAFRKLATSYDVVFDQFRPGVLDRLGAGHDVLMADNPRLVICALTGYGQTGPLRDRAGHDLNYLARSGLLGLMGPEDRPPQLPSFQLADVGGGLFSVVGILAALRERDRTGKGTVLDVAMTDAVLPFATVTLAGLFGGLTPSRGAEALTGGIAAYATYATKDGDSVTLAALEPKFLKRFTDGAGLPFDAAALVPGPHQAALKESFRAVFSSKTRAEWAEFGKNHDCCIEPVVKPDELMTDPQLAARGVFRRIESGDEAFYQYRTPVTPHDLAASPPPGSGEHTDRILGEAGFSDADVLALRAANIVK